LTVRKVRPVVFHNSVAIFVLLKLYCLTKVLVLFGFAFDVEDHANFKVVQRSHEAANVVYSSVRLSEGFSVYAGVLDTPKSAASVAALPLPPLLAIRLKAFLASKHFRQSDLGLVFANRNRRPFSANKLREKKLRPLLVSLGIPLAGFHAFRHGVATALIDRGASITTVGAQLRHSDPRITLGLYAHVVPQSQREAVESLATVIGEGQLLTQQLNADSGD
jgi:hypothetical protein